MSRPGLALAHNSSSSASFNLRLSMVDPFNCTIFDRTDAELEEFVIFCLMVAGKNATTTSKLLSQFLIRRKRPFAAIKSFNCQPQLRLALRSAGFGCYNLKSQGLWWLANSGLNSNLFRTSIRTLPWYWNEDFTIFRYSFTPGSSCRLYRHTLIEIFKTPWCRCTKIDAARQIVPQLGTTIPG